MQRILTLPCLVLGAVVAFNSSIRASEHSLDAASIICILTNPPQLSHFSWRETDLRPPMLKSLHGMAQLPVGDDPVSKSNSVTRRVSGMYGGTNMVWVHDRSVGMVSDGEWRNAPVESYYGAWSSMNWRVECPIDVSYRLLSFYDKELNKTGDETYILEHDMDDWARTTVFNLLRFGMDRTVIESVTCGNATFECKGVFHGFPHWLRHKRPHFTGLEPDSRNAFSGVLLRQKAGEVAMIIREKGDPLPMTITVMSWGPTESNRSGFPVWMKMYYVIAPTNSAPITNLAYALDEIHVERATTNLDREWFNPECMGMMLKNGHTLFYSNNIAYVMREGRVVRFGSH